MIPWKERSAAAIRAGSIAAGVSGGRHRNAQPHERLPLRAGRWARWRDVTRAAGRYTPVKVFTVIAAPVAPFNVQSLRRRRRETPLLPRLIPPPLHEPKKVFPAHAACAPGRNPLQDIFSDQLAVERADFLALLVVGQQARAREAARGSLQGLLVFGQYHVQQPETIEWNS